METSELGPLEDDVQAIKEIQNQLLELKQSVTVIQEVTEEVSTEDTSQENDVTPTKEDESESDAVFTISESGTQRGHPLLLDNRGYTYTIKSYGKTCTHWWCSMRNQTKRCNATVKQIADKFKEGKNKHSHEPKKSITKVNIVTEIKERSRKMINNTARSIVIDVIRKYYSDPTLAVPMTSLGTLTRLANRSREYLRPNNPKNLNFKINEEYMPEDFIKGDIECSGNRHILMATTDQLSILADTRIWMVDCTKKFVQYPFTQLLSIHTYVRIERNVRSVPLAYVLMSNDCQRDYKVVLQHLFKILPHRQSVRRCVLDLKIPLWKAFQSTIPSVALQGCSFHWINKIKKRSMNKVFSEDADKQVMALVYLPPEEVKETLIRMENKDCQSTKALIEHVKKQWVDGSFWTPNHWGVFQRIVRTSQDVEGWHNRIVEKFEGRGVGLYKLVSQLHNISSDIPIQWQIVSEEKLFSLQKHDQIHSERASLLQLWKRYLKQKMSLEDLFDRCTVLEHPLP